MQACAIQQHASVIKKMQHTTFELNTTAHNSNIKRNIMQYHTLCNIIQKQKHVTTHNNIQHHTVMTHTTTFSNMEHMQYIMQQHAAAYKI